MEPAKRAQFLLTLIVFMSQTSLQEGMNPYIPALCLIAKYINKYILSLEFADRDVCGMWVSKHFCKTPSEN